MPNGGSCLLGSINLSAYVIDNQVQITDLKKDVETIVEAMNEVLDEGLPLHPLQIQKDTVRDYRQIGIGVMGIADMLIKLKVRYGSSESINICNVVANEIASSALKSSAKLAKEYGAYPKYDYKVLTSDFFQNHADDETLNLAMEYGLRNSQLLTIAPTGSISNLLGISGGIEPIFANSYTRKTESLHGEDVYYKVYTAIVKEYMEANNLTEEEELPEFFVTASNIDYKERIEMQAVWQSHIDASISSTINLPFEATIEDVYNIYTLAWAKGLKGITIYRQGCKRQGILTTSTPKKEEDKNSLERGSVENTPIENCIAKGRKLTTGCGTLWLTAYFSEDKKLQHIFLDKGSKGGCNSFMCGLSRMISLSARLGANVDDIVDQLQSTVTCNSYFARTLTKKDASKGNSCPSAVGIALKEMFNEFNKTEANTKVEKIENECPVCGSELKASQGCFSCESCGYSKCDL